MGASTNTEKNNANEAQLLETVAARDPGWQQAFSSLMNGYRPYLYHRCMHHLGNSADVEDVLQDVFINVYRFAHRFERRAKLKTWLTRVADNRCYTFLRRRQQQVNVEYSLAVIEIHETAMEIQAGEQVDLIKKLVSVVMAEVSPMAREILSLRYWLEMPMEEISQTLGIGLSASKMRLHRAHQQCCYEIDSKGAGFISRQS